MLGWVRNSFSIDLVGTVKVVVTVGKKYFVICGAFSQHILFCCVNIVEKFDFFEVRYTKWPVPYNERDNQRQKIIMKRNEGLFTKLIPGRDEEIIIKTIGNNYYYF